MKKNHLYIAIGIGFLLIASAISNSGNYAPQTTVSSTLAQPSTESKPQAKPVAKAPEKSWKSYLPPEERKLREQYEQDPYIKSWFMVDDVWVGRADTENLRSRGFFINATWKFNGMGVPPEGKTHGSCTMTEASEPPKVICGKGSWGVQNDDAIAALQAFIPNP